MIPPLPYRWSGNSWHPLPRFAARCKRLFEEGEVLLLEPREDQEERSTESHKQYMALVNQAWLNLPEQWGGQFANATHLRKWCLINCGYRHEQKTVLSSNAEALKVAMLLNKFMLRGDFVKEDSKYSVVEATGRVVTVMTAKTQRYAVRGGMGRREFQKSKTDVLEYLDTMLGLEPGTLAKQKEAA